MSDTESPELGAAAARMIRALVERAAEGDTEALEQLAALETLVGHSYSWAGALMNGKGLYSFTELGRVVGIARQNARKRFTAPELPHVTRLFLRRQVGAGALMHALVSTAAARRLA